MKMNIYSIIYTYTCVYTHIYPRCSMCSMFTLIWVIFGVNVGRYSIHGASDRYICFFFLNSVTVWNQLS